jgi:hypothetical protein
MQLGRHLRELWRLRLGLVACALLAAFAAAQAVAGVSLFPPKLTPHKLETAAASTRVLVDAPSPSVLDLSVNLNDFKGMKDRALLVGNVMGTEPVRAYIARRAGVPDGVLRVSSPVTPEWPRPLATNGNERHTSDLLKSPDEYRISIQVNPTVPIVDVYAEAPDKKTAARLADGAVTGMQDYLRDLAAREGIPSSEQVRLEQLGRAETGVLNRGVSRKLALLVFVLVFAASAAGVLFLARVRRGWELEARTEQATAPSG